MQQNKNNQIHPANDIGYFQNVNCFVFHKAAAQNIYNAYYFETSPMCIFNAIKMQSDSGFIQGQPNNFCYWKML